MTKYIDSRGRLHDKEVTPNNPFPCNNANLYSAYGAKVGISLDLDSESMSICATGRIRHRFEDKIAPVMSRDEVLGLEYLGFKVNMDGWNFSPYELPRFNLSKFMNQARRLVVINPYYKRILGVEVKLYHFELAHRNTFWKESLDQIYHLAFSTPLQDRYSILKWRGEFKFYRPDHLFYLGISMIDRLGKPNGMRYLKYGGDKNMRAMITEFPADHPVRIKVGM